MCVTVGIPVYNEEELLRASTLALVEFLRRRAEGFEVLLGSNGSTDRTVEIGLELEAGQNPHDLSRRLRAAVASDSVTGSNAGSL